MAGTANKQGKRIKTGQPSARVFIIITLIILSCAMTAVVGIFIQQGQLHTTEIPVLDSKIFGQAHRNEKMDTIFKVKSIKLEGTLNKTLPNLTRVYNEKKVLIQEWEKEVDINKPIRQELGRLHAVVFCEKLSFVWMHCNKTSLRCTPCPPGWTNHESSCFSISNDTKSWEDSRRQCREYGGDLAIVNDEAHQILFTKMTESFIKENPDAKVKEVYFGLQDQLREKTYVFVNGDQLKTNTYWNLLLHYVDDTHQKQDCITISPVQGPEEQPVEERLNNWKDTSCLDKRHYLCETKIFTINQTLELTEF